jgi:hypothetical protein
VYQSNALETGTCGRLRIPVMITHKKIEPIPKNGVWSKVEEEVKSQPEEYMKYFEDLLFTSDKEIGP